MSKTPETKCVRFDELSAEHKRVFGSPSGFAKWFLKMPLSPQQAAVVDSFLPNRAHVSGLFCNEGGKTTKVITALVLWHVTTLPRRGENGGVTCTSGSWAQITNQLMPSIHSHAHRFPKSWKFLDTEIQRDGCPNFMAYSTTNPGRAEGFHGNEETPLMMLFDEAKSIKDGIIRAAEDRCRPQRMGLFSSPGYAVGKFYDSHTAEANFWIRHKVTVDDCPWIDREEMKRVITRAGAGDYERGLQDPFIRSAYFAEFMKFTAGSVISLSDIEECLADPPQRRPGERHAFCDFAAGGDENVLAVRVGNRCWIHDAWRDTNTMSAVGRFTKNFVELREAIGLRAEEIEGDADGLGKPMVDRLHEVGWPILYYHAESTPLQPLDFDNRTSELWFTGSDAIRNRQVILPDDADLKGQLVDRISKFTSSGKRRIESKKDLFARQSKDGRPQRSPDRADAILGAMARLPVVGSISLTAPEPRSPWHDDPDIGPTLQQQEASIPEEVLRGFDAGG